MKKLLIISGVLLASLSIQNVKAQEVNTNLQSGESQSSYTESKEFKPEKMKAEKPKFKQSRKEYGNEADIYNALEQRESIVIEDFDKDKSVSDRYVEEIRGYLISAIGKRGRLDIVNPLKIEVDGKAYGKTEYFGDGKFKSNDRIEALFKAGIRYVISGEILDYDTNEYHNAKGKASYESTITVRFTAYDLKEKEVLRTYNTKAAVHGFATITKADSKLMEEFKDGYESFIDKSFKLKVGIKEISQTTKKDAIKSCLIDAGKERGVTTNDNFDVYVHSGKTGRDLKKIGRMRATKNVYSEFSECNIISGSKQIAGALATGAELILLSEDNARIF